jgi:hypothetical protein
MSLGIGLLATSSQFFFLSSSREIISADKLMREA